jgi:hypothetical protein
MFAHASWSIFSEPKITWVAIKMREIMICPVYHISNSNHKILLSMEERRALFAISISSRVVNTADDNLERSNWLASVPVLVKYMDHECYLLLVAWDKRKFYIFHVSFYASTWLYYLLIPHFLCQGWKENPRHSSIVVNPCPSLFCCRFPKQMLSTETSIFYL